eukprot:7335258-Heterocapsa_arctica.AAC.1
MAAAGPRLGRASVLTKGDREVVVAEMTEELQNKGRLYSWYELQFWRLRFATSNMYGRARIDMQQETLRSCVTLDKLKKPAARTTPGGTKAEVAKEKLY